jgi:hypothetical protein
MLTYKLYNNCVAVKFVQLLLTYDQKEQRGALVKNFSTEPTKKKSFEKAL